MTEHHQGYQRALGFLWRRSAYERGLITAPARSREEAALGQVRTRALLDALGAPDRGQAILHVTGSKGKGSTVAIASAITMSAGKKTGRFTSPHLHSYRERIAIDDEPVSESAFVRLANLVEEAAGLLERSRPELGSVNTFELLTAMGLLAFAEARCAATILEVGVGGEFDPTNVVAPTACAITRIDLEHTAILGSTYEAIATTKSGIVKSGVPVAVGPMPSEAREAIARRAASVGAPMLVAGRNWSVEGPWDEVRVAGPWGEVGPLRLGLPGAYQLENAGTACMACWLLDKEIGKSALAEGLATARWPGRFEIVERSGITYVLDGAHTPAAAEALASAMRERFPGQRAQLVFGCSSDKNMKGVLDPLIAVAERVIATRSVHPRSAAPEEIAELARRSSVPVETAPNVAAAMDLAGAGTLVLVTGSLFAVAEGREWLGLAEADIPWGPWLGSGEPAPLR